MCLCVNRLEDVLDECMQVKDSVRGGSKDGYEFDSVLDICLIRSAKRTEFLNETFGSDERDIDSQPHVTCQNCFFIIL